MDENELRLFIETLATEHRQFAKFIYHLFQHLEKRMALDFTALNAAVAAVGQKVSDNGTATTAEINAVIAALAAASGGDQSAQQAAIDAATASLSTIASNVQSSTDALNGEIAALSAPVSSAPQVAASRKIVTPAANFPQTSAGSNDLGPENVVK